MFFQPYTSQSVLLIVIHLRNWNKLVSDSASTVKASHRQLLHRTCATVDHHRRERPNYFSDQVKNKLFLISYYWRTHALFGFEGRRAFPDVQGHRYLISLIIRAQN